MWPSSVAMRGKVRSEAKGKEGRESSSDLWRGPYDCRMVKGRGVGGKGGSIKAESLGITLEGFMSDGLMVEMIKLTTQILGVLQGEGESPYGGVRATKQHNLTNLPRSLPLAAHHTLSSQLCATSFTGDKPELLPTSRECHRSPT